MPKHQRNQSSNPKAIANYAIADQFSLLGKLMDIHGENSFKAKSYSSAAFAIEKAAIPLANLTEQEIMEVRGIGSSAAKKVMEIVQTGEMKALQDLVTATPAGVLEMMNIKGLGPKKINTLWKEMRIDNVADLETACQENRIAEKKGFGEKTQAKILDSIAFIRSNEGKFLYKDVEDFVMAMQQKLEAKFPGEKFAITGEFYRQLEIISCLEWVTTASKQKIKNYLVKEQTTVSTEDDELLILCVEDFLLLHFHFAKVNDFANKLIVTSGSKEFANAWTTMHVADADSEEGMFSIANKTYIPAYLREEGSTLNGSLHTKLESIVQTSGIKGLIHAHSDWSDGLNTIEEMANELIQLGFEYLVLSDHSKAAAYASGLSEQEIKEQHQEIDAVNKKLSPFKIFKSIECDILGDGNLDYDDKTLSSFDLVIVSIHSNLDMEEDKAMMRLLSAIKNPYTTILGHMTGRLLLRRRGYPVDHKAIIDACAENNVVIEINASPYRLDIDWRWIPYAMEKGLTLSINPDAHSLEEFPYVKYGTLVAQKGPLPASRNLSSFSLPQFEDWLQQTKKKKGLAH